MLEQLTHLTSNVFTDQALALALGVITLLMLAASGTAYFRGWSLRRWLRIALILVGLALVVLTGKIFEPHYSGPSTSVAEQHPLQLPAYDYHPFHSLPVEVDGRIKPMETFAIETTRHVTGRAKFTGKDPVAVVLSWMMLRDHTADSPSLDWEHYPFILCDNRDLRAAIYGHPGRELSAEEHHGKYVSPADLRASPGFRKLLDEAQEIRRQDRSKALQQMNPPQRKAEEVAGRLNQFDRISQSKVAVNGRGASLSDPIHLVALDKVRGGPWFSIAELRASQRNPDVWRNMMQERLGRRPQLYIKPEYQEALQQFQAEVKAGKAQGAMAELTRLLNERSEAAIQAFHRRHPGQLTISLDELAQDPVLASLAANGEGEGLGPWLRKQPREKISVAEFEDQLRMLLVRRNDQTREQLQRRLQSATAHGYHPEDPNARMLHLDFLEARFPSLYRESAAWQEFPKEPAHRVLAGFDALTQAYWSDNAAAFQEATQTFRTTLRQTSEEVGPYPGEDTIGHRLLGVVGGPAPGSPGPAILALELAVNRLQPFQIAWIIMLGSLILFITSMATGSKWSYRLGFAALFGSLGVQTFGLFARVVLAGRPPVTNMYETVVWVAFMSTIFAAILELIYRRKVIAVAGTLVATLGLVLADQLPLVLDPKISPLVPVLRSNYWLTIHVLTIVSSYAGGTLAWGLGNIALGLLAFGHPTRETLKTLSQFTYKAMQIAVLLLAAGTFLGGWWAAESWGRFWGWDPKEVWALIALVCYVIPLHMRYIGWVKDFGLAVSAVLCYAAIVMSWYGVNFVLGAGLHSYGFGGGGPWWVFWAGLINIEWVLVACYFYAPAAKSPTPIGPDAAGSVRDKTEVSVAVR